MKHIHNNRGFTLIEIMVVVVILAALAALVAPKIMGRSDDAKIADAKVQIRNLESALKLYKLDNGVYPSTEQGLAALLTKPTVGRSRKNTGMKGIWKASNCRKTLGKMIMSICRRASMAITTCHPSAPTVPGAVKGRMRISTVGTSISRVSSAQAGFTLMELLVVVAILALLAGIVLPRLPSSDTSKLRDSAGSLASAIRFTGDRASTNKSCYRLHLNITDNTTSIKQMSPSGEEVIADDPFFSRQIISDGVTIEDVITPQSGKVNEGKSVISFGPGGLQDFVLIHLKGGNDRHFTVTAFPGNGKVKVEEGYQETPQ